MNILTAGKNAGKMAVAWFGQGGEPIPTEQAQARANVCLDIEWTDASGRKQIGCPHNTRSEAWYLLTNSIARITLGLLGFRRRLNLSLKGDARLGTCKICLCSLRLKCFVPIQPIADETDDSLLKEMPSYCWQKHEIEQHRKA